MKKLLSLFCMVCLAGIASGTLTVITGNNWTFTPAADNLIANMLPSTVVNTKANVEGSPGPEALTDGLTAADSTTGCYAVGDNAVLTYTLGTSDYGYDVSGLNFYTHWGSRDNITIKSIEYEPVYDLGTWISIQGAALNFVGGAKCYAKYSETTGLIAKYAKAVRISFGPQENGYVGYVEIEIAGAASAATPFFDGMPFILSELKTGNTAFSGSNLVNVQTIDAPAGYDKWMVLESGEVSAVADGTWLSTNALPEQLTFTLPVDDTNIVLYAWFTNSTESVALRRSESEVMRYTETPPTVSARATYTRGLPSGGTVVVEPWHVDTGTVGGTSSGLGVADIEIPVAALELAVVSGPGTDQDASVETVTLNVSGSYGLSFTARNAAGNEATSQIALTVTDVSSGPFVWTGAAGTTTWLEPLNWDLEATPGDGADIVVNSGTSTPVLEAMTYPASGAYGTITINSGATVTCKGDPAAVNAASGGTAEVPHGQGVTINCENAVIGGTLTADGQGFPYISGPSGTTEGAGHGSVNYSGYDRYGGRGQAYGSIVQPTALGSGGNGGGLANGGGGAIKLNATGTVTVTGTISAKGKSRAAGGSIWLIADTFAGSGSINADGDPSGQGGAGGRVSIDYDTSTFSGTVSVKGGDTANSDGGEGTLWEPKRYANKIGSPEAPVTVDLKESFAYVFPDETVHYWNLWVTNGARVEFHAGRLELGTLTVGGASALRFDKWHANSPDDMKALGVSNISVLGTAVLCLPASKNVSHYELDQFDIAAGAKVYLGLGDFTAINEASGGTVSKPHGGGTVIACQNANIAGLLSGIGRGFAGTSGPVYSREGNAHGGRTHYNDGYGSLARPTALGAGSTAAVGGTGGGALKFVVAGTLSLGGDINADASDGRSAGGSVWVQAGTLSGAGSISANGGLDTRPGGGGRVAVETVNYSFTGQVGANGRVTGHDIGYPGTIFLSALPSADAFAGSVTAPDLNATYSNAVGNASIYPEIALGTIYNITNAIVVARTVSQWNPQGFRFSWTESSQRLVEGTPIDNTANYEFSNLPPSSKFVITDNSELLEGRTEWESDVEGVLSFTVPLGVSTHTIEFKPWSPAGTVLIVK